MKTYVVVQTETGVEMWRGEAESEQVALDAMARDAGYDDYSAACAVAPGDGVVAREVAS